MTSSPSAEVPLPATSPIDGTRDASATSPAEDPQVTRRMPSSDMHRPKDDTPTSHVVINVAEKSPTPSIINRPVTEKTIKVPTADPMTFTKNEHRRLMNFLGQYDVYQKTGSRNSDYTEKYSPDQPGEETGEDARIFKVYVDEAEKYDADLIGGLGNTLDTLLILGALFSAVVTTFVVDTAHSLQPDQALITSSLLYEQLQYLRANGNSTKIAEISPTTLTPQSSTHATTDVLVNALFFTSLTLALATALLSVLAKQWLQVYSSIKSGTSRDAALIRHLRFMGLMKWRVPEIVGALPLILHVSLALFSVGLVIFLRAIYPPLSWIIIAISGTCYSFYFVSIILPAIDISCPYRIPVLYGPAKFSIVSLAVAMKSFVYYCIMLVWLPYAILKDQMDDYLTALDGFNSEEVLLPFRRCPSTIHSAEALEIRDPQSFPLLVLDAMTWLHDMSSNSTVKMIAAMALAGDTFRFADKRDDLSRTPSYFSATFKSKIVFTVYEALHQNPAESIWLRIRDRLAQGTTGLEEPPPLSKNYVSERIQMAIERKDTTLLTLLLKVWPGSLNRYNLWGHSPLALGVESFDHDIIRILLAHGADPNFPAWNHPYKETALALASGWGNLDMARLLVDLGADVNLRASKDEWSQYPLYAASEDGHLNMVEFLLDKGAEVNRQQGKKDHPGDALQAASYEGHLDVVKVLLARGADVQLRRGKYGTALRAAIEGNNPEIVELLRTHGAVE